MTLSRTDREAVEKLVRAVEEAGGEIEQTKSDRSYDDEPIDFTISGTLWPESDT